MAFRLARGSRSDIGPKRAKKGPQNGQKRAPKRAKKGPKRGQKGPFCAVLGIPKKGKKWPFLGPCGAKSRGSGGAPPTHLILLRTQRTRYRERPPPDRRGVGRGGRGGGGVGGPPGWVGAGFAPLGWCNCLFLVTTRRLTPGRGCSGRSLSLNSVRSKGTPNCVEVRSFRAPRSL